MANIKSHIPGEDAAAMNIAVSASSHGCNNDQADSLSNNRYVKNALLNIRVLLTGTTEHKITHATVRTDKESTLCKLSSQQLWQIKLHSSALGHDLVPRPQPTLLAFTTWASALQGARTL